MKKNKILDYLLVNKNSSIKKAMRVIDRGRLGIAFVADKNEKLFGVVTDGDIRRAILKGINIEKPVKDITNKKPIVIKGKFREKEILKLKTNKEIKKRMLIAGSLKVPVVNEAGKIKDLVFIYPDEKNIFRPKQPKFSQEGIKRVLLTGGAGYLGSILCRKLLNKGYSVRVLDNLTYGDEGIRELEKDKAFEFLKGDIRNVSDVVEAIRGADAIIHLAAIVGDPACKLNPKETLEINYLATKNIVETSKYFQLNRFIFASTCSVYGQSSSPNKKLTEKSPLKPVSLYAETKIKCEQAILKAMDENFSPTILRMATLYGYSPNMRFDLAVNFMTAKAIFDKKIAIFGGEQWRPWLDVEDAAEAYINCLEAPIDKVGGEIFNILSENHRIIEVGKIINSIFPEIELEISKKITDRRNYNISFNRISKILNYEPKKKIADGVIEIKNAIEKGLIRDYRDPKYRTYLPQV
jgi:nucleoside-diphosphate-sugar epimerase